MLTINGKYNTAKVFTDDIDDASIDQLIAMLNSEIFINENVRIMPDVHLGKGSVVGFTSTFNNKVCPNIVGVDIGCGVLGVQFNKEDLNLEQLDDFIRFNIPHGFKINNDYKNEYKNINGLLDICDKLNLNSKNVLCAIGSLGSGNHFIEIGKYEDTYWLFIHSGSRNFGLQVATHHQKIANEVCMQRDLNKELRYLSDDYNVNEYLSDLKVAQEYALQNRNAIANKILDFLNVVEIRRVESIHNYIDLKNKIIRKGAISAQLNEEFVLPLNMKDGVLLCRGKGNADWNYSAPHGAGRIYSRSAAKANLDMDEFIKVMSDIYTTSVSLSTLDESPMAYKNSSSIINLISETCDIINIIKPIYNFKAN